MGQARNADTAANAGPDADGPAARPTATTRGHTATTSADAAASLPAPARGTKRGPHSVAELKRGGLGRRWTERRTDHTLHNGLSR
eukprot:3439734-Lingulodinium_polyedra.AAC.1